jgi:uridine kinase
MNKPLIIGIAGGSGSGKSTVVNKIIDGLVGYSLAILDQDSYYKHYPDLTFEQRKHLNFDHPDALDMGLMISQLDELIDGKDIKKPNYDFKIYNRVNDITLVKAGNLIIIEGILIFDNEVLRDKMDIKVFVETDDDIRFIRRMMRDIKERGRSIDSIVTQYTKQVRPMHLTFVEPTKRYADIIIPKGGHNDIAINMVISDILYKLNQYS